MASTLSLLTDPAREALEPVDVDKATSLILERSGAYPESTIRNIVEKVNYWGKVYIISPRVILAQILHETDWFQYGNDVYWWQFNFAGLGATGGIIGHMFTRFNDPTKAFYYLPSTPSRNLRTFYVPWSTIDSPYSVDLGVLAVVQHHAVYLYGRKANWPTAAQFLDIIDPRHEAVLKANLADTVMSIDGYGGKWAVDLGYGRKIVEIANLLPTQEGDATVSRPKPFALSFPLRVDHIPWTNANRTKMQSTPEGRKWITVHETGNPRIGADAKMHRDFTHNGGGSDTVSFNYTIDDSEVFELVPRGERTWQASDGTNGTGNSSVSIELCINADGDWERAKKNLAEFIVWLIANDNNLDLSRIAQHNTWARDNKNCPTKLRANNNREWKLLMAQVVELYKQKATAVPPAPPADPNALNVNGYWIINEIYHKWKSLGENTLPMIGYPIAGMRRYTIDGVERDGQIFERGVLAVYEEGTPDGVPVGHPFRVRMLNLQEHDAVVAYAIAEGEIEPFE